MDTFWFPGLAFLLIAPSASVWAQIPTAHMGRAEKGSCTFDEGFTQCDYQQDHYDEFDWTHINTQEVPYVSPELPTGAYMSVDVSQHDVGEKARFQLPVMKENDTHCIDFNYLLTSLDGSSPGTLNVLVKVNKGPVANPIWNMTSYTGKDWLRAELAVSTFWPNEYQRRNGEDIPVAKTKNINHRRFAASFRLKEVTNQDQDLYRCVTQSERGSGVIFEAEVSDSKAGFIAIDDIQVLSYPCDKSPHFLRLGDVERRNGEDIPVAKTKNINHRRFAASFRLKEVTNQDQDLYRCVTQSERGSGPPRPIAPPQLLGVGPTYLLIQLNANSIFGDGPIIVEYRMTSGTWTETHAVNSPNYKLWHLDPDTEYEIRVLLTRPGEGGTGRPGPPLITRTKCAEPMRTPKRLKIAETRSRLIAVDWESLGYNITRCHTFNVTICYHYTTASNRSKDDCLDMDPKAPRHLVGNLPPYTNVSLKMILTNPEGRKESDETIIQTDEDVPGPVPGQSVRATSYEDGIHLYWKEPTEPNGIIIQYEISYSGLRSFDPSVPLQRTGLVVSLPSNTTQHLFSQLHPGVTYQFSIRASTSKGFGQATTLNAFLNETATTITVLLKPAQAKGAPISAYQIVVAEVNPQRSRRQASSDCYQVPVSYHSASSSGSPYYFAAQLPPSSLPEPLPFTVGDNRTYQNYNIYLQAVSSTDRETKTQCLRLATKEPEVIPDPAKQTDRVNYNIYLQAVSSTDRETKTQCLRLATKGATEEPEVIPDPAKQTDRVVKIAGISAGVLVFILLVLVAILLVKKRR
ncbi:hypothetical protein CRUP_037921 [Coryphaenoides rupestris]|nr:hypothetical protein CRUP_037921 [Coryphaenoides rupestris]